MTKLYTFFDITKLYSQNDIDTFKWESSWFPTQSLNDESAINPLSMQPTSADISAAFIGVTSWLSSGTTSVDTPSIRSICLNPSIEINVNGCLVSFKPCEVKTKIGAIFKTL